MKIKIQNFQIPYPNNKLKKARSKEAKKENTEITGNKFSYYIRFIKIY
jgi:hypothetical protein